MANSGKSYNTVNKNALKNYSNYRKNKKDEEEEENKKSGSGIKWVTKDTLKKNLTDSGKIRKATWSNKSSSIDLDSYLGKSTSGTQKKNDTTSTTKKTSRKTVTDLWKDATKDATYSGDGTNKSYLVYATKMINDSSSNGKTKEQKLSEFVDTLSQKKKFSNASSGEKKSLMDSATSSLDKITGKTTTSPRKSNDELLKTYMGSSAKNVGTTDGTAGTAGTAKQTGSGNSPKKSDGELLTSYLERISKNKQESGGTGSSGSPKVSAEDLKKRFEQTHQENKTEQAKTVSGQSPKLTKEELLKKYGGIQAQKENTQSGTAARTQAMTGVWQDVAKDAKYSSDGQDRSWMVYAAKSISDSGDKGGKTAQEKLNEFTESLKTKYKNTEKTDSKKNEKTGPRVSDEELYSKYGEQLTEKVNKLADIHSGTMKTGSWLGERPEEVTEVLKQKNAKEARKQTEKLRQSGQWDNGDDMNLWSDGKRQSQREQWETDIQSYTDKINGLRQQIEENEANSGDWQRFLDLFSNDKVDKYRAAASDPARTDEDERAAKATLEELYNEATGDDGTSAIERAMFLADTNINNLNDVETEEDRKQLRREVYDRMNGDGAYDERTQGLSITEKYSFDKKIDEAMEDVWNANGKLAREITDTQGLLEYTQDRLEKMDNEDRWRADYDRWMSQDVTGDTEYHRPEDTEDYIGRIIAPNRKGVNPADEVYKVLGGDMYSEDTDITSTDYHAAMLMNQDEKDRFMAFYNSGDKEQAWAFYQGIEPVLNQAYSYYEQLSVRDTAARIPVMSSVGTLMMTASQTGEFIRNMPTYLKAWLAGEDNGITDPNSSAYTGTRIKNYTRSAITNALGEWGWVYSGVMSGADSALNAAIGKGLGLAGKAMEYGTLALFGSQAFETSLQSNLEKHNNNFAYDFMEAFIDTAIETATEVWSVENWLAEPTNLMRYVSKIAISEPSEEIAGAIAGPYIKELLGHKNEWNERAIEIWGNGGYTDGNGKFVKVNNMDEATRQAMREWNHEIRMSAQEALLSVAPGMVYGSAQIMYNNTTLGDQILGGENREQNLGKLLETAEGIGEGSDSSRLAQKLKNRMSEGKTVSKYQAGQLATDTYREAAENNDTKAMLNLTESIDKKKADVIRSGMQLATEDDVRRTEGERVEGTREGIFDGKFRKIGHAVAYKDENGNTRIGFKIEENGQEQTVDASELRTTDFTTAQIIKNAAVNPEMFSAGFVNTLMEANEKGKVANAGSFLMEATKLRLQGYLFGNQELPETGIDRTTAEEIYTQAIEEHAANRKEQTKGSTERKGTGRVRYNTAEYGTDEWKENIKNLDKNVRKQIEAGALIAQKAGIDVTFLDEAHTQQYLEENKIRKDVRGIYGWENEEGIGINTEGVDRDSEGTENRHHIVVTFGHEMTHWMQRNSLQGYNRLERFVMDEYAAKYGKNRLTQRIQQIMESKGLDIEDAMSEMVADSSDQILANEQVVQHIQETDTGLYNEIKGFVSNLVQRVKDAVQNMELSRSQDAFMMRNSVNDLSKAWLGAYDDALSVKGEPEAEETGTEQAKTVRYSEAEIKKSQDEYKGRDLVNDQSSYDYDFLTSKPDIHITTEIKQTEYIDDKGNIDREHLKTIALNNAEENGRKLDGNRGVAVKNIYTGRDIIVTGDGAIHGTTYKDGSVNRRNARASAKIGELVKTAIPLNSMKDVKVGREGSYAMAAPMRSADGMHTSVAVIVVDEMTGNVLETEVYDQIHSASVREQRWNEAGLIANNALPVSQTLNGGTDVTRSEQSITEFINLVNSTHKGLLSRDVLSRIGEVKPAKGYWAENTRFSEAETNEVNDKNIRWSSREDRNNWRWVTQENGEYYITDSRNNRTKIEGTGREYAEAWYRGDYARMEQLIEKKLEQTEGVIPYKAPAYYSNEEYRTIANQIKKNNPEAIATAAERMAKLVPDNAVLIPIPNHHGEVNEDTDTMVLAQAISKLTGKPVIRALEGTERESRKSDKGKSRKNQMQAADLGFRKVSELPEGAMPVFVDNVVSAGVTAQAAHDAFGYGFTLAYAKSSRTAIDGLKDIGVTYNDTNKQYLVPYEDRLDMSRTGARSVRYSEAETEGQKESTRYSSMTEEGMDVNAWLAGRTYSSFRTEDERAMWQKWKDLRIDISLSLKRQMDYKEQIRKLESRANLDAEGREELRALRNKLQVQQEKMARLEDEMAQATSREGFAGMMYRENMVLQDFLMGRTQEQVTAAVDSMVNEVQAAEKQIAKEEAAVKKMADNAGVKTVRDALSRKGLSRTAAAMKSQYMTAMSMEELQNRLAEIVLQTLNGADVEEEIQALANDITTNTVGYGNELADEVLGGLRGMTITIGPGQRDELKAQNSSLKEIRERTKGSGIKFVYGETSTLDTDAAEIIRAVPSMEGKLDNEKDSLENFVSYVQNLLEMKKGRAEDLGIDTDEVEAFIAASVNIMLNDETGGLKKDALKEKIRKQAGAVGNALRSVEKLKATVEGLKSAGTKAATWAGMLNQDMDQALSYYNKMAKLAAQNERKIVKEQLIEQLKSENTRKLLEQQEKYEQMMKNDRRAREIAENNRTLRNIITTDIKRIKTRLTQETDQKNIAEEAKPLARIVSRLLVENDTTDGNRKVLNANKKALADFRERLTRMDAAFGEFDTDTDLDWLVVKAPNEADNDYSIHDKVIQDLINIESGLLEYRTAEGRGLVTLQDRQNALRKVQGAVSEILDVIQARTEAFINGRRWQIYELAEQMEEDMEKSRFKGERTGWLGKAANTFWKSVGYGNLTPEYFFKNMKNRTMELLHKGFHEAEQRSGIEALRAKMRIAQIAEDTGFNTWDGQEKHTVKLLNGRQIEMTTEQIMALYATWMREQNQMRPEETAHLLHGGFVLAQGEEKGVYGRRTTQQRPIRMTESDLGSLSSYLTAQQIDYVERIVEYMSGDLAELGNEASMKAYGIKKFTEKYYYPIKSWGGVLNKSSASGTSSRNENRAMQQSFTKRIRNNANNAIEISDFTPTAMKHIVGMITFNTVGPAVENMNKVLNQQLEYEAGDAEESYKRNMRASFEEHYGKNAYDYLVQFMDDVNGGVARRIETNLPEKLLSVFKKSAVAGSLSVAAQQPLSYIRAAMEISPKYLAEAISPANWKGSYQEMLQHSGVYVIKDMGKFDMNYGRSMIDYITPEGKTGKVKAAWTKVTDAATSLPEKMDAMTWTRMWSACKLEQKALNPEMDVKSEAFLNMVAERFNEVMRKTQVYDSVMVKSQNMRSTNYVKKVATSFMAEPTLSLNVLSDAMMNIKEKGGKKTAAKALATFVLSAAAQAAVKGFFGAGRNPDDKKSQEENFMNKFAASLTSELNPLGLIPGYSQLMDAFINGEVTDDAMGVIGKAKDVVDKIIQLAQGDFGKKGEYRMIEDSIGQLVQYMTKIPAKNFMRDFRAMVNFFSGGTMPEFTGGAYAQRESNSNVMKYQMIDTLMSNELGAVINSMLGTAGYGTESKDYVRRIYNAEKTGNNKAAEEMKDFLMTGKGKKEEDLTQDLRKLTKEDETLTYEERIENLRKQGLDDSYIATWISDQYKDGKLTKEEATRLYKLANPEKTDEDVYFKFEQLEYEAETGVNTNDTDYFRLNAALESGDRKQYESAVEELKEHGHDEKDIDSKVKSWITGRYKDDLATREETTEALKEYMPDLNDDDIWWTLDLIDYKKETGDNKASGKYYRLYYAIKENKSDDIRSAVQTMVKHGVEKKNIVTTIGNKYKQEYLNATGSEKTRLKDALTKAYKAAGLTAEEALEKINGWKKSK